MKRPPLWTPARSGVAACLCDGLTARETSRAMRCSQKSVQRHTKVLAAALGARNRVHLAAILGAQSCKTA